MNTFSVILKDITSAPFIMPLFVLFTDRQNYYTNYQALLTLIYFIILTVFAIFLCTEFLPTMHYSPQHNKYITLCVLISTLHS